MTDARTWLDQVDAIHNQVIRNDQRAEWQRLTAEHDALPAATTALRAVLDLHRFVPARRGIHSGACSQCWCPYPCLTVTAITTALTEEDGPLG